MNRYAVIKDETGEVVNVIVWDGISNWKPPEGHSVRRSEECGRGDIWIESMNDFVRPLFLIKPLEDEISIAQRKTHYEESKKRLGTSFLVLNDTGSIEKL